MRGTAMQDAGGIGPPIRFVSLTAERADAQLAAVAHRRARDEPGQADNDVGSARDPISFR